MLTRAMTLYAIPCVHFLYIFVGVITRYVKDCPGSLFYLAPDKLEGRSRNQYPPLKDHRVTSGHSNNRHNQQLTG